MRVKRIFVGLSLVIIFIVLSLIVSLHFIDDVEDYEDLFDGNQQESGWMKPIKPFKGEAVRERFRKINLKTLERSQDCRFSCRPAIKLHSPGRPIQFEEAEPSLKVMVIHCLRCLRKKGFMHRIVSQHTRRKRDLRFQLEGVDEEVTTARKGVDASSPQSLIVNEALFHKMFGGWISSFLDKAEMHSRQKILKQNEEEIRRSFKKRALLQKKRRKNSKALIKLTKKPIIFSDHDEDEYVNNYGDETMKESVIADTEKLDKKMQDTISYGLIYTLAGLAILFMVAYPGLNFWYMMRDTKSLNACLDLCCCKDPSYKLVKNMCETDDILIPTYSKYVKLKKQYKKKLRTFKEEEDMEEIKVGDLVERRE